jgi:hypothetical protein
MPASAADTGAAFGDSVMLGARTPLRQQGFHVDAVESRQAYTGPALLRHRSGTLPTNVVVHLGTNGTYPLSTCKALVNAAGISRHVFLVTVHAPRSWKASNNRVIQQCASSFPASRVTVIDWDAVAQRHPSWLYSDHIHLKPTGARGYARMIASAVRDASSAARTAALAQAHGSGRVGVLP